MFVFGKLVVHVVDLASIITAPPVMAVIAARIPSWALFRPQAKSSELNHDLLRIETRSVASGHYIKA
jgi:hypothetical protein